MLKAKSSSPFSKISLSSLKSPKTLALIVFFIILAALPIALYEVQQQQSIRQHAAWYVNRTQHYYCNSDLSVDLIIGGLDNGLGESPDCSSGFNGSASSFQASMIIKASPGSVGAYTVHYMWGQFWCQDPNASPCLDHGSGTEHTGGLTGDNAVYVTAAKSDVVKPVSPYTGQACGVYQLDFGFYVTPNDQPNNHLCTSVVLGVNQLGQTNNNASWCNTQNTCTVTTNTPTPTSTPSPTLPINTPTVTDTPTNTPTLPPSSTPSPTSSPSATPTFTITPTFTVTPTGTLTPTLSPTPTPTGTTPPPTNTPPPTIIVVKPTLPPTGPSNTIVAVGLVGVAISVLGLALLIGI